PGGGPVRVVNRGATIPSGRSGTAPQANPSGTATSAVAVPAGSGSAAGNDLPQSARENGHGSVGVDERVRRRSGCVFGKRSLERRSAPAVDPPQNDSFPFRRPGRTSAGFHRS